MGAPDGARMSSQQPWVRFHRPADARRPSNATARDAQQAAFDLPGLFRGHGLAMIATGRLGARAVLKRAMGSAGVVAATPAASLADAEPWKRKSRLEGGF